MNRLIPLAVLCAVAIPMLFFVLPSPQVASPNSVVDCPQADCPQADYDGLPQAIFDNVVRIRNRTGTGSGSVVADLGDVYEIETNHHVAGARGTRNVIDIWSGGDLVHSVPQNTVQSWFEARKSKDIAILHVPKSLLQSQTLTVIDTAPPGYSKNIKAGDKVFMVGCSDGRWPRARCGNVLKVVNGLIYYDPKSIGGDSGSAVYHYSSEARKWYAVGRTAWAIMNEKGRWVGLAMDSDRVIAIREGRVSTGWQLPTGAKPLDEIDLPKEAPNDAVRLDVMRVATPSPDGEEPQPLETGIIFNRDEQESDAPRNLRQGMGSGAEHVGRGIGIAIVAAAVLLVAYLIFRIEKIVSLVRG